MAKGNDAALPEELLAAPPNCRGALIELPSPEGVTFKTYGCPLCHQIVHVGLEDLELNGLPPEHSPVLI